MSRLSAVVLISLLCLCFFKQKTEYDVRCSDWSSDVCSSDLPASFVQDSDPGGDRRQGDRTRDDRGVAQGRDRQMLWRRYHAQTEASGEAEGRQETDARIRLGKHSAGGFHRRAAHGRRKLIRNPVADREVPLRPRDNNGRRVMRFMAMTGAAALAMALAACSGGTGTTNEDRKSTRLNSSH